MTDKTLAVPQPGAYQSAYEGAMEEVAIWKKRALEAEAWQTKMRDGSALVARLEAAEAKLANPVAILPSEKVTALGREAGLMIRIDGKFGNPNYVSVSASWPALLKFTELILAAANTAKPVLMDIEQYRIQMAGISTAAFGYLKEGDPVHPDYDTLALRDVAKLYAKYDLLFKAQPDLGVTIAPVIRSITDPSVQKELHDAAAVGLDVNFKTGTISLPKHLQPEA